MDNKVYVSVNSSTANPPLCLHRDLDKILAADIAVRCAVCEEDTCMNSTDYRARGVFICDKCKAAIKHVRNYLEVGGSVT